MAVYCGKSLSQGQSILGRFLTPDEAPIPDVEVRVERARGPRPSPETRRRSAAQDPFATMSEPEGRFRIDHVPAGTMDLLFSARSFVSSTLRGLALSGGREPLDLGVITLKPGVTITGVVVDPEAEPVVGAEVVRLESDLQLKVVESGERFDHLPAAATSDAEGMFRIPDLARDEAVHLLVRCSGYRHGWVEGVEAGGTEPVIVVLERAAQIRGRVVDEREQPIAGAYLLARAPHPLTAGETSLLHPSIRQGDTRSDHAGHFVLEDVRTGTILIDALARGYLPTRDVEVVVREAGETVDVEIVLARDAVLEGYVVDSRDQPVDGARISIGPGSALSDAEGYYRAEGIPPGPETVLVDHRDYSRLEKKVEIEPGVHSLELVLAAGFEVSGRVVDPEGSGIEGVRVQLLQDQSVRRYAALSEAGGSFAMPAVAPGEYSLAAEKQGYAISEVEESVKVVDEPVWDLRVPLTPGITIAGRLLGLGRDELARVEVTGRWGLNREVYGLVDRLGSYELPHLAPGDWEVRASLPGGDRQVVARAYLESGMTTQARPRLRRRGDALGADPPRRRAAGRCPGQRARARRGPRAGGGGEP